MSIALIKAKQRELADIKAAADKAAADRENQAVVAFAETGIPALWEQIKFIKVPHWRGNGSRENNALVDIPLQAHAKQVTATSIELLDWDGEIKAGWKIHITDKGAVWYVFRGRKGTEPVAFYKPLELRDHFVDYMARFLPPLDNQ